MANIILYGITILVWGTTWYAIKLQIGYAPNETSIFYRALLAALCLIIWCKIKNFSLRFSPKDHIFFCLLGLSMFSLHYLFVYSATKYIVSGIIAVVFSATSFLSIINNFIFFKVKPKLNVVVGTFIGISGLCLFFLHEIVNIDLQDTTLKGLTLAGTGTIIFSLGGIISKRNNKEEIPIISAITMGMIYGAIAMFIYILLTGESFVIPENLVYWGALFYLVLPGSIIAFLCYLQLIKNIGPEFAGYTTVLFPVVALLLSSFFEGYEWSTADLLGLLFIIIGNICVMMQKTHRYIFIVLRKVTRRFYG